MRRAGLGCMAAVVLLGVAAPARAQCGDEIRALRERLASVTEPARKAELEKLLEKAQKDEKAGRARLCEEDLKNARILLN